MVNCTITSPFSATSPSAASDSRYYSNFDFSSYYGGLNHPFTITDSPSLATSSPSPSSIVSPVSSSAPPAAASVSSLFSDTKYSLFSADAGSSLPLPLSHVSTLPPVIDMPFQQPTSPSLSCFSSSMSSSPYSGTQSVPMQSEAASPTCTNRDSPYLI